MCHDHALCPTKNELLSADAGGATIERLCIREGDWATEKSIAGAGASKKKKAWRFRGHVVDVWPVFGKANKVFVDAVRSRDGGDRLFIKARAAL